MKSTPSRTRKRALVALVLSLALPAQRSFAKDAEADAQRTGQSEVDLNSQGVALYQAGRYREAVEVFLGAYAVDKDPNTLFNIARCYELLNEPEAALKKYEAFLASPDIEPAGRERATRAVQALQERSQAASAPQAEASTTAAPASQPSEAGPRRRIHDKKVLIGWIATGALVAATAVTGGLTLKASKDLESARAEFPADSGDLDHDADKTTTLAITTDVLGGAALVMAAVSVYWTVKSKGGRELKVSAGAGHLNLRGTF